MRKLLVAAVVTSFLIASPALAVNTTCFTGGASPDTSFDVQPATSSNISAFQVRVFQYGNLLYNPSGNITGWSHGTDAPYGDGQPYPTNNASYTLSNLYVNGFSMPLNGTYTAIYSKQVGYDQINPGGTSATLAGIKSVLEAGGWTYCTAEFNFSGGGSGTSTLASSMYDIQQYASGSITITKIPTLQHFDFILSAITVLGTAYLVYVFMVKKR